MYIMKHIPQHILDSAISYATYRTNADQEIALPESEKTDQQRLMADYTRQNVQRMKRWDRTMTLSQETLERARLLDRPVILLTLTEAWCGDASQIVPVLAKIAEADDKLELRLLYRDQHLEIMDAFLTAGSRSIPKVIFVDPGTYEVLGTWGPRPSEAQAMLMDYKKMEAMMPEEERHSFHQKAIQSLHSWYTHDKGIRIQTELMNALWEAVRLPVAL